MVLLSPDPICAELCADHTDAERCSSLWFVLGTTGTIWSSSSSSSSAMHLTDGINSLCRYPLAGELRLALPVCHLA